MRIGSVWLELLADGLRFRKDVADEAQKAGDAGGQTLARSMASSLRSNLGTALGAALGLVVGVASRGAAQLTDAMAEFRKETGATAAEVESARKSILGLSKTNLQSFDEMARTQAAIRTELGLTQKQAEAATESFLEYGEAVGRDAAEGVQALDRILDAWNLDASKAAGIMDQLVASHQAYGGSIASNEEALANLAPQLIALNLSLDDGIGLLNLFQTTGLDASKAQMALNTAIRKLPKNTSLDDFVAHLAAIEDPAERARQAIAVFGSRGGAGLANSLRPGMRSLSDYTVAQDKAAGATKRASDAIKATPLNQLKLALRSIATPAIEAGQAFGPLLLALSQLGGGRVLTAVTTGLGAIAGKLGTEFGAKIGGSILDGIAPVLFDAAGGGSRVLNQGGDALGRALGTTIGKAAAVTLAAALVVEVYNQWQAIQATSKAQLAKIGADLSKQVTTGSLEDLERSRAAIAKGLQDLYQLPYSGIYAQTARAGLERQLADIDAALDAARRQHIQDAKDEGAAIPQAMGEAMAKAAPAAVADFSAAMQRAMSMGSTLANVVENAAKVIGQATPHALAEAIRSRRGEVDAAWETLLSTIKDNRGPEDAKVLGRLLSKTLAKALKSNDPLIRQTAKETRAAYIERLGEIVPANGKLGKKARRELAAALDSKDPVIKKAAEAIQKQIEDGTIPKVKSVRDKTVDALTQSITAATGPIGTAAYELGTVMREQIIAGLTGKSPASHGGAKGASAGGGGHAVARASGGPVAVGRVYQINERRQELFAPSVAGRMIDPKVASMSGIRGAPSYDSHDTVTLQVGRMDRTTMPDTMRQLRRIGDVKRMRVIMS